MPPVTATAVIAKTETVYRGWLAIRRAHLRDGAATYTREIEHHGNGAAVLPYDPVRRCALVVRMPRAPVLAAGGGEMLIEAPAGLVEEGEEPGACVRREAMEEAGLRLDALEPIGTLWTMPGISTERLFMFLAPYTAADRIGPGGGLASENESIAVAEMPLAELARLADANALPDLRILTMLLTLRVRHPHLF